MSDEDDLLNDFREDQKSSKSAPKKENKKQPKETSHKKESSKDHKQHKDAKNHDADDLRKSDRDQGFTSNQSAGPDTTKILTWLLIIVLILTVIFVAAYYALSKDTTPIANNPVNLQKKTPANSENEAIEECCQTCINYGKFTGQKSCSQIISQNYGPQSCKILFANYPHSYGKCKDILK